jgi:hypothetical protein
MVENLNRPWYQFTTRELFALTACIAVTFGAGVKLDDGCESLWTAMIACVALFVGPGLAVGLVIRQPLNGFVTGFMIGTIVFCRYLSLH